MKTKKKQRKQTQKRGQRFRKSKRFQMSRRRKSVKGGAAAVTDYLPNFQDLEQVIRNKLPDPSKFNEFNRKLVEKGLDNPIFYAYFIESVKFPNSTAIPFERDMINSYDVGGNPDDEFVLPIYDSNVVLVRSSSFSKSLPPPTYKKEYLKIFTDTLPQIVNNDNQLIITEQGISGGSGTQPDNMGPNDPVAFGLTMAKRNREANNHDPRVPTQTETDVLLSEAKRISEIFAQQIRPTLKKELENNLSLRLGEEKEKRDALEYVETVKTKREELKHVLQDARMKRSESEGLRFRSTHAKGAEAAKALASIAEAEVLASLAESEVERRTEDLEEYEKKYFEISAPVEEVVTLSRQISLAIEGEIGIGEIEELQNSVSRKIAAAVEFVPEAADEDFGEAAAAVEFVADVGAAAPSAEGEEKEGEQRPPVCCEKPLIERLQAIDIEISNVHNDYLSLLNRTSAQTLIEFVLDTSPYTIKSLDTWRKNVHELLYGYQRISKEDLKKAFFRLLNTFDPANQFLVNLNEVSPYHILIKTYAYKMVTTLFTNANITAAVFMYQKNVTIHGLNTLVQNPAPGAIPAWPRSALHTSAALPVPDKYEYLRNLLSIMKGGSEIINTYLKRDWNIYMLQGIPEGQGIPEEKKIRIQYYHSGGNMIVMIAGMLCYLYDKERQRQRGNYIPGDILEDIRQRFEARFVPQALNDFHGWLARSIRDPIFKQSLYDCTLNLSDLDFILMVPKEYVNRLINPFLQNLHSLSARIIRNIMITAYSDTAVNALAAYQTAAANPALQNPALPQYQAAILAYVNSSMVLNAQSLLPFHQQFGLQWKNFGFYKMPGGAIVPALPAVNGDTYKGYRQTCNKIDSVPMYLNRLKQGYLPFFNIPPNIPPDNANTYSNKYGECIDLSIGTLENPLYSHKHHNYEAGTYYTIDTILWELEQILLKPPDDKTAKRTMRRNFLTLIDIPEVNILFQTIGSVIQYII